MEEKDEIIELIQDCLDEIEEHVDELEDIGQNVDEIRDILGEMWNKLDELS